MVFDIRRDVRYVHGTGYIKGVLAGLKPNGSPYVVCPRCGLNRVRRLYVEVVCSRAGGRRAVTRYFCLQCARQFVHPRIGHKPVRSKRKVKPLSELEKLRLAVEIRRCHRRRLARLMGLRGPSRLSRLYRAGSM